MKERFAQLLLEEGLTASRFAEIVGVQPSGISHILSGRNKPGYDLILKILTSFPYINPDWLLLNKGEMYRDGVERPASSNLEPTLFDTRRHVKVTPRDQEERQEGSKGLETGNKSELDSTIAAGLEETSKMGAPEVLVKMNDLFSNSSQNAHVTGMMLFFSDDTVVTYKLKK